MANCPKCKEHLRLIDWKQHCPHCGANIVLYDIQERLMQDADKAELQYYYSHKRVERMKAAFAGSKLAIARLVLFLVPILAIVVPFVSGNFKEPFVPFVSGNFKEPFVPFDGTFGLFSLLDIMDKLDTDAILGLLNTPDGRTPILMMLISIVLFILSIVLILVRFFCLMMACSPKGKPRNYILDILLLVLCITGSVLLMTIPANPYFEINMIIAPLVYLILLLISFGVDIAVFKQGIDIKYEECYVGGIPVEEYFKMQEDGFSQEEIRQEMYRRLTAMQKEKIKEDSQ